MLSPVQVRRRRIVGAVASLAGVLLVVLAIMGMTGRLGAGGRSTAADPSFGSTGAAKSSASKSAGQSTDSSGASDSAAPSDGAANDSSSSASSNPDLKSSLTVLNDGGPGGLAGRGRDAFVAKSWEVSEVGNYTGKKLSASTIFYPADNPDAEQAAKNLQSQFPKLTGLEQSPADLKVSGVVVVLTGDWDPKNG